MEIMSAKKRNMYFLIKYDRLNKKIYLLIKYGESKTLVLLIWKKHMLIYKSKQTYIITEYIFIYFF